MFAVIAFCAALSTGRAAADAPPMAHAILSVDGHYSLVVQPDSAWTEGELTVAGDGVQVLGPVEEDQPVKIDGWTSEPGPLRVTLRAVAPDKRGITWTFEVDADLVPVETPVMVRLPKKRGLGRIFGRGR